MTQFDALSAACAGFESAVPRGVAGGIKLLSSWETAEPETATLSQPACTYIPDLQYDKYEMMDALYNFNWFYILCFTNCHFGKPKTELISLDVNPFWSFDIQHVDDNQLILTRNQAKIVFLCFLWVFFPWALVGDFNTSAIKLITSSSLQIIQPFSHVLFVLRALSATSSPRFGQPETALSTQLGKMRYPTLQRVAHTLPKDPKYRAHVVRSIRALWRWTNWLTCLV